MRLGLLAAALAAIVFGSLPTPATGQGSDASVVTFEDYPANISGSGAAPPITDEYASEGLIFPRGVTALLFNDKSFPPRPDLPRSGETVITTCYSSEFCSSTITMAFDPPLTELSVYAGYSQRLDRSADLLLEGYNNDGKVIVRDLVTIPAADQATPARNVITIEDRAGEIAGAQVRWVDENRFLGQLIVDDVTVTPFVVSPELSADPSPIEIAVQADPVSEAVVLSNTGNVPLSGVFLTLDGFDELAAETSVAISAEQRAQCLELIEVDRSCEVLLTVTPGGDNEVEAAATGALTIRGVSGRPILETPVTISVTPPVPPASVTTATTVTTVTEPPELETTDPPNEEGSTTASEGSGTTTPAVVDEPESEPDESLNPVLIIGGIILLGLILRWLIRRPKKPPPPPQPAPPQPRTPDQQRPDHQVPRPSLSARPDVGTQTIETKDGAGPSLVVALNDHPSATILIDHHQGTVQ